MALPFVPRQCSSPPVNECLWDALAPAVSVFPVHTVDVWKHLSTHVNPPVYSYWFGTWYQIKRDTQRPNLFTKWVKPCPYQTWDVFPEVGFSAMVNGEYVSLFSLQQCTPAKTVCVGTFLNAAIPLDWMDRFTHASSTSAVHKEFN